MKDTKPPKILFIGAVTFEETSGSHALFYRLFENYPTNHLQIIGSHKSRNDNFKECRLPDVEYHILDKEPYWSDFRFQKGEHFFLIRWANLGMQVFQLFFYYFRILKIAKSFEPDMVLSLTMDFHWYMAFKIAKRINVPLDLVLHDRWEPNTDFYLRKYLLKKFEVVFRSARNRFCISPTMERFYFNKTGVASDVVYPTGKKCKSDLKQTIDKNTDKKLTVVFFGNIWKPQIEIDNLAHILHEKGIDLVFFSNRTSTFFKNIRHLKNVKTNLFLKQEDLIDWCKCNADILYLPMYFDAEETEMVQCSFPSKIVDYTSLGLPVLIHAPEISSIVKFAQSNNDLPFSEIVTSENRLDLERAVDTLMNERHRQNLGENSLKIWKKFFAPDVVRESFFKKIDY